MIQLNFKFKNLKQEKSKIPLKSFLTYGFIFFLILIFIVSLPACSKKVDIKTLLESKLTGEDQMNAAVGVVDNFFKYVQSNNLEEAFKLISTKDKSKHSFEDFKNEFKNVTKIVEYKLNWVEVKNNIAEVGFDLIDSYDNEEKAYKDLVVSLIKEEDGSWKINFWD